MKKYLKFLALVFVAALSVTMVSCGDDDEADADYQELIVGKWALSDTKFHSAFPGAEIDDEFNMIEFFADGRYETTTEHGIAERGTYRVDGKKLQFKTTWSSDDDEGMIVLSDVEIKIDELTSKQLILTLDWGALLKVSCTYKRMK